MSFGKKVPYSGKTVAQSFGPKAGHHTGQSGEIKAGDKSMTSTPSGGAGMKSVGSPKFGFSTSGRKESALKQADPDASGKDETYPFVGRQAGKGRVGINSQKSSIGNFVKAPIPPGAKGNLKSKSAPKGISKFFGNAIKHPGKIAHGFTKTHGGKAPANVGFSAKKSAKSPAQDAGERHQAPRKIARSFGG